ncbi:TPA_asm: hypothetical protein GBZ04_19070 [Salmonella enterica subsp. diarizonae]|uniref:Uncharacterized protein n=1 Tax=Salmonella diarizonae TaxID=59204 RepID=A0A726ZNU7_SALDZ|nr:hypothetical protein [Salmonella enterica subsp. diarizonae]HAE1650952.1 hypothetical protein [Salmonella enterica subsp. diarizonae]
MNGIDDIQANIERERYKLISEVERFEKLKVTYEQLVEKAKTDPKIASQLKEFEVLHGEILLQDMVNIADQIRRAKEQYQSLKRMVAIANTSSVNMQPQKIDGNATPERKEALKPKLYKSFM